MPTSEESVIWVLAASPLYDDFVVRVQSQHGKSGAGVVNGRQLWISDCCHADSTTVPYQIRLDAVAMRINSESKHVNARVRTSK